MTIALHPFSVHQSLTINSIAGHFRAEQKTKHMTTPPAPTLGMWTGDLTTCSLIHIHAGAWLWRIVRVNIRALVSSTHGSDKGMERPTLLSLLSVPETSALTLTFISHHR